MILMMFLKDKD